MPGTPAASSSSLSSSAGSQHVFAVNDICFHKTEGTFGTGGSDGSFTFWDGVARTKLKRESRANIHGADNSIHNEGFG